MIELLRQRDITRISYYQSLLEEAGIQTFIRNENISNTEVSIPEFFPALCIVNDADEDAAVELMRKDMDDAETASDAGDVTCPKCSEVSPANFGSCWNCGTALEGMMA